MKNHLIRLVLLSIVISSCGIYTKSNVRENAHRKNIKDMAVDDYKDVDDSYHSFFVATPLLIFDQKVAGIESFTKSGLTFDYGNRSIGSVQTSVHYLLRGLPFKERESFSNSVTSKIPRIQYDVLYVFPFTRKTVTIDRFQMHLGGTSTVDYYSIMPMKADIEWAVRGGISRSVNSFASDTIESLVSSTQPGFVKMKNYGDKVRFVSHNHVLKLGISFQRRIATRYNTVVDGMEFRPRFYNTNSLYADVLILAHQKEYNENIQFVYDDGQSIPEDYPVGFRTESMQTLFTRRPIGAAIGYRLSKTNGIAMVFTTEIGVQPGYFPTLASSIFGNMGFSIGIGRKK